MPEQLESTGVRPHSDEALPALETPWAGQPCCPQLQSRGGDGKYRDLVWGRVPGSMGSVYGDRQLSNAPGRLGFSDEKKLFQVLSHAGFALGADTEAYRTHDTRSAHTPCGLWAANKQFIKTKSISGNRRNFQSASTCFSFPVITSPRGALSQTN